MGRSREFYGLSKSDRLLALSGVPLSYLKKATTPKDLNFSVASMANQKRTLAIPAQRQREVLMELLENIDTLGYSGLYGVGTAPTEQAGYELATLITRSYSNAMFAAGKMPTVRWVDLARPPWEFLKSDESCELVVIHGLSELSDPKRIELACDFAHRSESSTTIVVAKTENILKFIVHKVGLSPDSVWQLTKTTHEVFL